MHPVHQSNPSIKCTCHVLQRSQDVQQCTPQEQCKGFPGCIEWKWEYQQMYCYSGSVSQAVLILKGLSSSGSATNLLAHKQCKCWMKDSALTLWFALAKNRIGRMPASTRQEDNSTTTLRSNATRVHAQGTPLDWSLHCALQFVCSSKDCPFCSWQGKKESWHHWDTEMERGV